MKTAEELFVKYKKANWEHEYAEGYPCGVTNYKDFNKALTEHDKEMKQLIDEMIEETDRKTQERFVLPYEKLMAHAQNHFDGISKGWYSALTELKSKIGVGNERI